MRRKTTTQRTLVEVDLLVDTEGSRRIAGTRDRGSHRRQLLFRAGELYADLQLQRSVGSSKLLLTGQLVGGDDPASHAHRPLELEYEDGTTLHARTNELGEFLLNCPPRGAATLEIELERSLGLTIPLPADALSPEEEA